MTLKNNAECGVDDRRMIGRMSFGKLVSCLVYVVSVIIFIAGFYLVSVAIHDYLILREVKLTTNEGLKYAGTRSDRYVYEREIYFNYNRVWLQSSFPVITLLFDQDKFKSDNLKELKIHAKFHKVKEFQEEIYRFDNFTIRKNSHGDIIENSHKYVGLELQSYLRVCHTKNDIEFEVSGVTLDNPSKDLIIVLSFYPTGEFAYVYLVYLFRGVILMGAGGGVIFLMLFYRDRSIKKV